METASVFSSPTSPSPPAISVTKRRRSTRPKKRRTLIPSLMEVYIPAEIKAQARAFSTMSSHVAAPAMPSNSFSAPPPRTMTRNLVPGFPPPRPKASSSHPGQWRRTRRNTAATNLSVKSPSSSSLGSVPRVAADGIRGLREGSRVLRPEVHKPSQHDPHLARFPTDQSRLKSPKGSPPVL